MKTTVLVVGSVTPVAVVPQQSGTKRILLFENGGGASQAISLSAPTAADAQITRAAGSQIELTPESPRREFIAGEVIGWLLAAGPINVAQEEHP